MKKLLESIKMRILATVAKAKKRKMSYRELLLAAAVAVTALFLWGSGIAREFRDLLDQNKSIKALIAKNDLYLSTKDVVGKRLEEKAHELQGGNEISGTDLLSIIGELASQTGLKPESSSRPTSKTEGPFDIITVRIALRNAPLDRLVEFDECVSNEYASVAVTNARFTPSAADGLTLTASYEITAFLLRDNTKSKQ